MLTEKQRETMDYICGYIREHGYPPTFIEMATALGVGTGTVNGRLLALAAKGFIERPPPEDRVARGIKVLKWGEFVELGKADD